MSGHVARSLPTSRSGSRMGTDTARQIATAMTTTAAIISTATTMRPTNCRS